MTCDNCSKGLAEGEGYAFYSGVKLPWGAVGNMLICEACAHRIVSAESFAKPSEKSGEYEYSTEVLERLNADSIVGRCKTLGLTPEQALRKAGELATEFFRDNDRGAQMAYDFWS